MRRGWCQRSLCDDERRQVRHILEAARERAAAGIAEGKLTKPAWKRRGTTTRELPVAVEAQHVKVRELPQLVRQSARDVVAVLAVELEAPGGPSS